MLSVTSFLDYKVSIHPGKETSIICGASSRLRATAAKGGLLFTGLFKDGIAPRASISRVEPEKNKSTYCETNECYQDQC